jgi:hypothetical protein
MHTDQETYRELYDAMLDYEDDELYRDVVAPWLTRQDGERRWLDAFARRSGTPIPEASTEDLWRLYALSRIVQLLELSFMTPQSEGGWGVKPIRPDEFAVFMDTLGLQKIERPDFHPFFHEVVSVDPTTDDDAPVTIAGECWPGYMLGPLLLSRAGCAVTAGARHLTKSIAEHSTLYWTFARHNRPYSDLSDGWGSNSQWRTTFRRDYHLDGVLHYNVDANPKAPPRLEELDEQEKLELLRHRCFVTCPKPDEELWPYYLTATERLVTPPSLR